MGKRKGQGEWGKGNIYDGTGGKGGETEVVVREKRERGWEGERWGTYAGGPRGTGTSSAGVRRAALDAVQRRTRRAQTAPPVSDAAVTRRERSQAPARPRAPRAHPIKDGGGDSCPGVARGPHHVAPRSGTPSSSPGLFGSSLLEPEPSQAAIRPLAPRHVRCVQSMTISIWSWSWSSAHSRAGFLLFSCALRLRPPPEDGRDVE